MAATNRASKIATLFKVAKKQYQPVKPPADRSVLEHMLYACCLEDSLFDAADIAFARLQQSFFDWNEVRVTTATELSEVMDGLNDPGAAAARLKRTLHSMFESHYSFDIDHLRKENLGKAVLKMEKYRGITPFVISYVAQNALGGHAIPVSGSLVNLMLTVSIIDEKEAAKAVVPGLERAISKNKGVDFFSVAHQLAVAWSASPHNRDLRAVLLTIDPTAQERFPKRTRTKKAVEEKKPARSKSAPTDTPAAPRGSAARVNAAAAKAGAKKSAAKKPADKAPAERKSGTRKKTVKAVSAKSGKSAARKKTTARKSSRKSPAKRLARKKPR